MRAVANFVEVANSTTGEGDFNLERLSMLHSVATGYSSLIFGMKSYMGFAEFYKKCINLWRALEENPKLPQYLVKNMIVVAKYHKTIVFNSCILTMALHFIQLCIEQNFNSRKLW